MDPDTGGLKLALNLTGMYGAYELVLEARDKGLPKPLATKETIRVEVQDFNDHPPKIWQPTKQALYPVPEVNLTLLKKFVIHNELLQNNYTDYFVILQIRASDKDHGKNAEIIYRLKPTVANDVKTFIPAGFK